MMFPRRVTFPGGRAFTLIELVVTITIIILTISIVSSTIRKESPSQVLDRMGLEFRAYCARVRYRACESGRDWVVSYDPDEKNFSASLGKYERFRMPGSDDGLKGRSSEEDEEETDETYAEGGVYAPLVWKLPEGVEFTTEDSAEDSLMVGEKLEVFRFFPDGGGSGSGHLELRCGDLSRIFRITRLTGRLVMMEKEEFERERDGR